MHTNIREPLDQDNERIGNFFLMMAVGENKKTLLVWDTDPISET